MTFWPRVGRLTVLASVSSTHSATGSPVMVFTDTPEPGRGICVASCMAADWSCVLAQISAATAGGRLTPAVVRLISTPAMAGSLISARHGGGLQVVADGLCELLGGAQRGVPPGGSLRPVGLGGAGSALRGEVRFAGQEVVQGGADVVRVHGAV